MILVVWICTDKTGSKQEKSIEIPEDQFDGMCPDDAEWGELVDEWCRQEAINMLEWGYKEVS